MLDSKETARALDQKDMLGAIEAMPKHLADGIRRGRMSGLPRFTPREVVICGMGGSAIGGDLLEEWMAESCEVPCRVCRSYKVPANVGKDSLVLVSSYSGNTEESLSMFDDARKKKAKIVSISSGGQLSKMSESCEVPFTRIPPGMMPRASLGYVFGAMLGILERSGVVEPGKQPEEAVRIMNRTSAYCKQSVPTNDNPAKMIAHELFNCVPVVIGYDLSRPVARRWANQMNENGKVLAFSAELPELDHNEISGWAKDPRSRGFAAVFLDHDGRTSPMSRRVKATKDVIGKCASVYSIDAIGLSPLAKMFSLVLIGDYASVYMAFLRHVDPSSNETIDDLKAVLSKK